MSKDYKELGKELECDHIAVELKRRVLDEYEKFYQATKEYGNAERANASTNHEKESDKYFAMLEGYALAKIDADWSVAFDAVSLFVYGEK